MVEVDEDVVLIRPLRTAGAVCSPVNGSIVPCMSAIWSWATERDERRYRLSVVVSAVVSGVVLLDASLSV